MVVTKDIECAILYYRALNKIVDERKLPYKILIAFSGEKQLRNKKPEDTTAEAISVAAKTPLYTDFHIQKPD